ncbi:MULTISPECIES: hypothetical protein [unclassified Streptomyces]|uniref:hypothetical protein n=1 Tax=unclassified Streptomyces TaxID=2593676 RepID=UPI0016618662|nr:MULTISPECIES: hypothetical protein [unclassified Streptomyces]MBD0707385.1 hypothetical protein [Streptomyces sp. CBMA291]MBD0715163.1 hypothetical protein [Streptomyces sp. CBMA370]
MSTNVEATQAEIDRLGVGVLAPGLAQLALSLAASVDTPGNVTAQANAARELRTALETLRKLAPPAKEMDAVDELAAKKAQRREDGLVRARRA